MCSRIAAWAAGVGIGGVMERIDWKIQSGPCVICGAKDYPLSMGGSSICPACDCDGEAGALRRLKIELEQTRAGLAAAEERAGQLDRSLDTACAKLREAREGAQTERDALIRRTIQRNALKAAVRLCDQRLDAEMYHHCSTMVRAETAEKDRDTLAARVEVMGELLNDQVKEFEAQLLIVAPEDAEVERIGDRWGYGAVMSSAARLWHRKYAGEPAVQGGVFTVGHCIGTIRAALSTSTAPTPMAAMTDARDAVVSQRLRSALDCWVHSYDHKPEYWTGYDSELWLAAVEWLGTVAALQSTPRESGE